MKRARRFSLGVLLPALLLGCQTSSSEREFPKSGPFIALERDFQGFRSWSRVDLSQRAPDASTHTSPDAHEYINRLPEAGAKEFPVGTILVKSSQKPGEKLDIFAMVKRGPGYNANGAPGWEWFELSQRPDQSFGILWRGMNPPDGQGYGGLPAGGCNGCHESARKNDFVQALPLASSRI